MEHKMGKNPRLNIIFDSRRPEKYDPLISELERQNITDYELWPCIMYPDVVASINASHKMIVRDAKEKKLKYVCIAEDDLWIPHEKGWQYYLDNMPDDFDLYLACTLVTPVTNNVVCGFHLYMVAEKFYDTFLAAPDVAHIDSAMNDIKGDYKFCYPFAAIQRPGYSHNNKTEVNYNGIFQEQDVYGKFR